jgi:hypothetical protein
MQLLECKLISWIDCLYKVTILKVYVMTNDWNYALSSSADVFRCEINRSKNTIS